MPLIWFLLVGGFGSALLLLFFSDYSLRYAYAWLSFYLGCSGCSAFVFFQAEIRNRFRQYLKTYPCDLISALVGMIAISVLVHGFALQATGVLTMLMCLGAYPLLCFLWSSQNSDQRKSIFRLATYSILFVLFVEAILMTSYVVRSLPMSSAATLAHMPRVFLNVRDGNQWLALGSWIPLGVWWNQYMDQMDRSRNRGLIHGLLSPGWWSYFLFWYLAWLTQGRGALLALAISSVCVCVALSQNGVTKMHALKGSFLRLQFVVASASFLFARVILNSNPFADVVGRTVGESADGGTGRLAIWLHWLSAWLETPRAIVFGQGWGVVPDVLNWVEWSKDPHSIYVQILADGGLFSVLIIFFVLFRTFGKINFEDLFSRDLLMSLQFVCFGVGLVVYQAVDRVWAIHSGLWMILFSFSFLLCGLGLFGPSSPKAIFRAAVSCLAASIIIFPAFFLVMSAARP